MSVWDINHNSVVGRCAAVICVFSFKKGVNMKKGFTLIELLVVIAIIALLLAIIMPALNAVKVVAQKVVCRNNVRQQVLGVTLYSEENNSYVPNADIKEVGKWLWDINFLATNQIAEAGGFGGDSGVFFCGANKNKRPGDGRCWQFSWAGRGAAGNYPGGDKPFTSEMDIFDESDLVLTSWYRVPSYIYLFDRYDSNGNTYTSVLPDTLDTGEKACWIRRLSDLKSPGTKSMIVDAVIRGETKNKFDDITDGGIFELSGGDIVDQTNHLSKRRNPDGEGYLPDGGNVGYADGHADWRGYSEMRMRRHFGMYFYW